MPLPPSAVMVIADAPPPAGTLSAAEDGFFDPVAQTVTGVAAVAQPAETLRATAATPVSGTLPAPGTRRSTRWPAPSGRVPSRAATGSDGDAVPTMVRTTVVRQASRTSRRHDWSVLTRADAVTVEPAP